jgi:hypothetical protein
MLPKALRVGGHHLFAVDGGLVLLLGRVRPEVVLGHAVKPLIYGIPVTFLGRLSIYPQVC